MNLRALPQAEAMRGTVATDELRRINERAERYVAEQATNTETLLALRLQQDQVASARIAEARDTRAIAARAATLRAEGTTYLVAGVAAGMLLGALLLWVRR